MKFIPLPVLQIARAFGLVRGLRTVRVPAGRRMRWAVAVQVLGRWRVVRQPQINSPYVMVPDSHYTPRPLLFPRLGDVRSFLDRQGL
ncbi:hypothetical protein [Arenimonas metalli]|uniref:Uncharacterized protein n=1 Tax=Arenimonas metalli CF5-1 TaxID=1384056 RepID=A0A091AY92_9GAMM|nr:hypothetical protein [Arenimonas metalli]KFN44252.1 hypothetical protein N787_13725 [Arenimonas metalli CF5-1]